VVSARKNRHAEPASALDATRIPAFIPSFCSTKMRDSISKEYKGLSVYPKNKDISSRLISPNKSGVNRSNKYILDLIFATNSIRIVAVRKIKMGVIGDVDATVINNVVMANMTFNRVSIYLSLFVWAIVSIVE
jgi:hypothetical protein